VEQDFKKTHDRFSDKLKREPIAEIRHIAGFNLKPGFKWIDDRGIVYCSGAHTLVHAENDS
jgi:hypothetical protein